MGDHQLRIYEIVSAHALSKTGSGPYTVARHELTLVNALNFNPEETTITFEGSLKNTKVFLTTGLDFEMTADGWPLEVFDVLFDDAPVTTGLPAGVGSRRYYGASRQASTVAGLELRAKAIDDSDGSTFDVLIVVPRATFSAISAPNGKSKDKAQLKLKGSAIASTKDMANNALPGIPAGDSCTWWIDTLDAA